MDTIGIGAFLFNLAFLGGAVVFLIGLLISRFIFKWNWLLSAVVGVVFAIATFFLAPHAFFLFLKLSGVS